MENFDPKAGSKDIGGDASSKSEVNMNPKENVPGELCWSCQHNANNALLKRMVEYQKLDDHKRLEEFKKEFHLMNLVSSYINNSPQEVLQKEIQYLNDKIGMTDIRSKPINNPVEVGNSLIPQGAKKLEVDLTELELSDKIGELFLTGRSLKKNQIFRGDKKQLAQWVADSFILQGGKSVIASTIQHNFSTDEKLKIKD